MVNIKVTSKDSSHFKMLWPMKIFFGYWLHTNREVLFITREKNYFNWLKQHDNLLKKRGISPKAKAETCPHIYPVAAGPCLLALWQSPSDTDNTHTYAIWILIPNSH